MIWDGDFCRSGTGCTQLEYCRSGTGCTQLEYCRSGTASTQLEYCRSGTASTQLEYCRSGTASTQLEYCRSGTASSQLEYFAFVFQPPSHLVHAHRHFNFYKVLLEIPTPGCLKHALENQTGCTLFFVPLDASRANKACRNEASAIT